MNNAPSPSLSVRVQAIMNDAVNVCRENRGLPPIKRELYPRFEGAPTGFSASFISQLSATVIIEGIIHKHFGELS